MIDASQDAEYRYDAFISYRHVEPDRSHAQWLHRALETYRTPKPLVRESVAARIERVFRDEDELPASADLSKEIDHALDTGRLLCRIPCGAKGRLAEGGDRYVSARSDGRIAVFDVSPETRSPEELAAWISRSVSLEIRDGRVVPRRATKESR